jgi:dinuclear metal center YbgI/SA1388 family protein
MVSLSRLHEFCNELLGSAEFDDYCPNGLQVESGDSVERLVSGVTASQALIDAAVGWQADVLLVHHGYFWKGESPCIRGIKGRRIGTLMRHGVSLLAYHLPLDSHHELGNNRQLADRLGLVAAEPSVQGSLVWQGRFHEPLSPESVRRLIAERLGREPLRLGGGRAAIHRVAWCTGAAQGFIGQAAALGVDAYISGEVSEQTSHLARELGIHYFAAGHHATERYGVQALGERLVTELGIQHRFIDIPNPV